MGNACSTSNGPDDAHSSSSMPSAASTVAEAVVGTLDDFKENEPKEVAVEDHACVVVKSKGEYYAVSAKCTHYGASLAKGSFDPDLGILRCPWHGACFNVCTGDIEDFPGLDSLHVYKASADPEGNVRVRIDKTKTANSTTRRRKEMCSHDPDNGHVIAVIGGGGAAQACVETLRNDCRYDGRLIMFIAEPNLPYDRPKLSKSLSASAQDLALRPENFYKEGSIEVKTGHKVVRVDTERKTIYFENDAPEFHYDQLIVASGSSPRTLPIKHADCSNVCTLRTPQDANHIAELGQGSDVVVVGSSFIGMEVAAFFATGKKARSVTVVGNSSVPFERSLGPRIGQFFKELHEAKGVNFEMGTSVAELIVNEAGDAVKEVVLANGKRLPAGLLVLGIGVTPNTEFLKDSGVDLTDRGFVSVTGQLKSSVSDIYAAGDVAAFPLECAGGAIVSIGHWQLAHALGRTAALNITGHKPAPFKSVPFFWTQQYGKSFRYAGYSTGIEDIVYDGDVEKGSFVAYFCNGAKVEAVATLMRDPVAAQYANLLRRGSILLKTDIGTEWYNKQ